ncbi:MAG TPA: methyl-accepting chemotaxis protein, partial [Fibrobacteraceae bacterium]|nr:methyl-accepting chemotaxis protein [Fibrobacteraceae bacterium]
MTITQQRLFSSSKSPLRTKLFFQLLLPLFLLMGVGGFLIYRSATASLQKAHHEAHLTMRKALVDLVELSYDLTEQEVSMDVRVARAMIVPHVSLSNAQIPVEAVNQKTRESQKMDIPEMALDGKLALGDKIWVDSISRLLGNHVAVTLFQVIPGGMLRVSTTVKTSDGKRATGTYIPESSPVYQKIMSGQRFQGRAMVADEWYVTAYEPLLHQGKVIGALFAGVPQGKMDVLRHRIVSFRVGEHGFAQIIDTAGKQIIHPDSTLEGSIRKSAHHQYMLQEKEGDIISKQQSNLNGKKGSFVDYAFARIPEMQWIVSACAYQDELLAPVRTMQKLISVVMLACLLLAFFLTSTFSRGLTRRLEATSSALREIASGEADLTRRLPLKKGDEFMELAQSFNRFTERLQQMIQRVAESTRTLQGNADHLSKESHQLNQNMESLRSQAL